jgi:hypothetical protein
MSGIRLLIAAVTLVVAASVVVAIVVLGSPAEQRQLRLDERRVADLIGIRNAVTHYIQKNDALPPNLSAIARQEAVRIKQSDPETGTPYEYEITGEMAYRLCAVFARKSEGDGAPPPYFNETGWEHEAGHQCFDRSEPARK